MNRRLYTWTHLTVILSDPTGIALTFFFVVVKIFFRNIWFKTPFIIMFTDVSGVA